MEKETKKGKSGIKITTIKINKYGLTLWGGILEIIENNKTIWAEKTKHYSLTEADAFREIEYLKDNYLKINKI